MRNAQLRATWISFVGPLTWHLICTASRRAAATAIRRRRASGAPADPRRHAIPALAEYIVPGVTHSGVRATLAVASAAAHACARAIKRADSQAARTFAALFDACVEFLPWAPGAVPADAAARARLLSERLDTHCERVRARGWHGARFPPERTEECPAELLWTFRETFLVGPTRSGGSVASTAQHPRSRGGRGGSSAAAAAAAATTTATSRAAMRTANDAGDDDDDEDDGAYDDDDDESPDEDGNFSRKRKLPEPPPPDIPEPRALPLGAPCAHVAVAATVATYAGYDRADAVATLLHKGWPHKLQLREVANITASLLRDWPVAQRGPLHRPRASGGSARTRDARRTATAAESLVRWWTYAALGRWENNTPLTDWALRARLVHAVDLRRFDEIDWHALIMRGEITAPPTNGHGAQANTTSAEAAAAVLGIDPLAPRQRGTAHTRYTRAQINGAHGHVVGATLAIQAVVVACVRRLAPLRVFLCTNGRWERFENASCAALEEWRARGPLTPAHDIPRFFTELMNVAPRDTDPNSWLVYVGRCLRSRGITAASLDPAVERAFRIGIAAVPDIARLAWPMVQFARGEHVAVLSDRGAASAEALARIYWYVGRDTAMGSRRPEWDANVPVLTMCAALALAEVVRAALLASGVEANGCEIVFNALRDMYVCNTGPRVQATRLVERLAAHDARILNLLAALHNVCATRVALCVSPLDSYTAAAQTAARAGVFSGGRDDWLLACHTCRRPHTLVSGSETRGTQAGGMLSLEWAYTRERNAGRWMHMRNRVSVETSAATSAAVPSASRHTHHPTGDHGFRDVAIDTHDMVLLCKRQQPSVREVLYPIHLTGRIVWLHGRCYTMCPLCGTPAQLNPQRCAYVGRTFACDVCSVNILRERIGPHLRRLMHTV